ncbi:MAG TPA: cytochrome P450, partial [Dehalococcoidia bacterium]|nr:cytochrome P450 [Dehalococcoidia bacterium]
PMLTPAERAEVEAAGASLDAYFRAAIAERREDPRDDLISHLVNAEDQGDRLTEDEIVRMCGLLLAAGNVTTTDLIGNGVLALLQNPSELQKLQNDPSLIKNAVEEMLRYDPPVTQSGRVPLAEFRVDGATIAAGQSISPMLAAGNRDPDVHPDPDRFDITRPDLEHHSFGGGVHYCLGAPLARLEAQLAVGTLVRRFPAIRLAAGPLEWRRVPSFRGLMRLLVYLR